MLFDGNHGYITASYAFFFAINIAMIGGIWWHRAVLKKQLAQLDALVQKTDTQAEDR